MVPKKKRGLTAGILVAVLAVAPIVGYTGFRLVYSLLHPAPNVILRLSGSNTIGAELAPSIAQAFLSDLGAKDAKVVAGANEEEKTVVGTLPGDTKPSVIQIEAHGSETAFTGLAEGSCDIGMASRKIRPDESTKLSALGDMTSPNNEVVLGLDGIAVIVNQSNRLASLTKEQLARVFSGEVTEWSAVGGGNGPIDLYVRDNKSGTFETFRDLVLAGSSLAPSARRFEDSAALSDAVAADPNGIGFIGVPYVRNAKAISVSDRNARPLLPIRFTIATEDYPLSRRLYLYAPANPQNKFTHRFIQFAISKTGQSLLSAHSFVAQTVTSERQDVPSNAPEAYRKLTSDANRLSLDFRFRKGSASLDNKALVDLDRVITFVSDLHYSSDSILLFGFTDETEGKQASCLLSEGRALTVAEQFRRRGLTLKTVRGICSALPVASNDTDEGREKNRRVEIWVRR